MINAIQKETDLKEMALTCLYRLYQTDEETFWPLLKYSICEALKDEENELLLVKAIQIMKGNKELTEQAKRKGFSFPNVKSFLFSFVFPHTNEWIIPHVLMNGNATKSFLLDCLNHRFVSASLIACKILGQCEQVSSCLLKLLAIHSRNQEVMAAILAFILDENIPFEELDFAFVKFYDSVIVACMKMKILSRSPKYKSHLKAITCSF